MPRLGVYIPTRLLQRTHSPRFSSENPPTEKSTDKIKTRYFAETGSLSTSLWFRGCRRAPPALMAEMEQARTKSHRNGRYMLWV